VITSSRATLSIYSEALSVANITRRLGIEPHDSAERGAPTREALAGQALAPERMANQRTKWSYDADPALIDASDHSGFAAVQVIADVFCDHADALRGLREDCEIILWWSGDSDSSQGGFVIPAPLLICLAALGCDLYGTAFLIGDDE